MADTRLVWVSAVALSCFLLTLACCSAPEGRVYFRKGLVRNRRQTCADGTYEYDGRNCCLCAPGLKLDTHCTSPETYGKCNPCDPFNYNSQPTSKQSCEPCISCDHPNANLEVDERCTPARNAKCRCKKDYYCINELPDTAESCKLCHPCKECGAAGIKVACTATNNTVCNEERNGPGTVWIVVGVLAALVVSAVVAVLVFCVIKRFMPLGRLLSRPISPPEKERLHLDDLQPHLVEIVDVVGWKCMKKIAIGSGIPMARIDCCERDNPMNTEEQTLQLLHIWMESEGRDASENLIQKLRQIGKRRTAEKVIEILCIETVPLNEAA